MIVKVALLHFDGGKRVPQHRLHFLTFDALGDYVFEPEYVHDFRRVCPVATLWQPSGCGFVLPKLLEAQVLYTKEDRIIVRGLEMDEVSRRFTAQAWWIIVQGAVLTPPHEANPPATVPKWTPAPQAPVDISPEELDVMAML